MAWEGQPAVCPQLWGRLGGGRAVQGLPVGMAGDAQGLWQDSLEVLALRPGGNWPGRSVVSSGGRQSGCWLTGPRSVGLGLHQEQATFWSTPESVLVRP